MAKLSITRFLETSRFLATDAGKQLNDLIIYLSDFAEQTLRALRNGLTFQDNFNCQISAATLKHNVPQVISSPRRPFAILHSTTSSTTAISSLVWFMNDQGQLTVIPEFKGAPADQQSVVLVLIFQ